jgi:molybdenum cofactor biosynthesis protein B
MSKTARRHKSGAPVQLQFSIFVCSTSRFQLQQKKVKAADVSGDTIESILESAGHVIHTRKILADDETMIRQAVQQTLNSADVDAAVFCGGTGITPLDVTIESVTPFLEKVLPGFGEIFRKLSFDSMGSAAVLSRAIAGVAKGKAFFCIPGSPDAVKLSVERLILPEAPHIVKHARE